jgi:hypothetical protein
MDLYLSHGAAELLEDQFRGLLADRTKVDDFVERLMRNALGAEISQKLLAKRPPPDRE